MGGGRFDALGEDGVAEGGEVGGDFVELFGVGGESRVSLDEFLEGLDLGGALAEGDEVAGGGAVHGKAADHAGDVLNGGEGFGEGAGEVVIIEESGDDALAGFYF